MSDENARAMVQPAFWLIASAWRFAISMLGQFIIALQSINLRPVSSSMPLMYMSAISLVNVSVSIWPVMLL